MGQQTNQPHEGAESNQSAASESAVTKEMLEYIRLLHQDKSDAREMYKEDNSLQKWYAMSFLFAYFILTIGLTIMLVVIYYKDSSLKFPDWVVALLSSIWGGMSTKVSTITDFLFGSSKESSSYRNDNFSKKG